jgi:RNAse (barnase) inhibitor barstar
MEKFTHYIKVENCYFAYLDGKENLTLQTFYFNIAQALQFPDYFTQNLDSINEILSDLSWIEEEQIVLFISNYELLLKQEDEEIKQIISDILTQAEENMIGFQVYYK